MNGRSAGEEEGSGDADILDSVRCTCKGPKRAPFQNLKRQSGQNTVSEVGKGWH